MSGHTNREMVAMFLANQEARSFSEFTVKRRRSSLGGFVRWIHPMGFDQVTPSDIEEWISSFGAARTRHAYRSDVCAFYGWAVRRHVLAENPAADTDSIRVPRSLPRPVPSDAVRHIIASAPTRDLRLGLALATFAGLRRSEIVNLTSGDISVTPPMPMLTVRCGKWAKDRQVPIHPELLRHLERRRVQGRVVPMSADWLGRQAADHIRRCGYDMTIHQMRATFATELARITKGNVLLVARLLGHESIETSAGYIGLAGYAGSEQVSDMYSGDAA